MEIKQIEEMKTVNKRFIIALTEEKKKYLTNRGFSFINENKCGKESFYLFENKPTEILNFSKEDFKDIGFSDVMFI
ncbi:TPA: hypothetical protein KQE61_003890 [Clostridioides difficile]|uniref:hypothetical protein n=1 Tax=Clostridioides difficile TaxID=1496 RepID=UPI00097FDA90|nr:hypothetical protein [Clostridioides difficile]EGT5004842.1 hypothetical protein [Clostridioides difficile]EJX2602041.1 hypothetical protein [Clostridioides difficile]EKG0780993.1 hypothetical protein [Clostridioides difficile]EKG0813077.1 hypothetical protein [Clostridioides difficile]MBH6853221.1 hypothetical protein [Clostridioides difficile]